MASADRLIVTCEHGGNEVPAEYVDRFRGRDRLLTSHRGYDPGALELARAIAAAFDAPLHAATVTRLLVDLNRSLDHPNAFSEVTRGLTAAERNRIADRHHAPYRLAVEDGVRRATGRGGRRRVLHVSVHTFTPVLRGARRRADIGVLFDPKRAPEAALADEWTRSLRAIATGRTVMKNSPYRGWTDGLCTHLRTAFPAIVYAGIELEVNQKFPRRGGRTWARLRAEIVESLRGLVAGEC